MSALATTSWPDAAIAIAFAVCLTVAWCAFMWAVRHGASLSWGDDEDKPEGGES